MNRAQLRDGVYDRSGLTSTDARMGTAVVDRFINAAIHEIEAEHDWPWLQASTTIAAVSGTGSYAVPTDWLRTRYLRIDSDVTFDRYEISELEDHWPDSSERGRPYEYAIEVDAVVVRPIPDTSYTITHRYIKRESDLNSDDASPLMPATFHPAICELAVSYALRATRDEPRAQQAVAAYEQWRQRMVDDRRRTAGPGRIRIRPGGWF